MVCALLTVAHFHVITIRALDKPTDRASTIRKWNDPKSPCEVFFVNINTLATGVNLHHCCHIAVFLNWHTNAETMRQAFARIVRLRQTEAPLIYLLKIKNTYHDQIERICLTKYSIQVSAEIDLPDWLVGVPREIVVWEAIKASWHTPFNRYAWVMPRYLKGGGGFTIAPKT